MVWWWGVKLKIKYTIMISTVNIAQQYRDFITDPTSTPTEVEYVNAVLNQDIINLIKPDEHVMDVLRGLLQKVIPMHPWMEVYKSLPIILLAYLLSENTFLSLAIPDIKKKLYVYKTKSKGEPNVYHVDLASEPIQSA